MPRPAVPRAVPPGYVDHGIPAILISVLTVCLFGGLWFVLPLAHRRQPDE